jgi:hypothetical protein
MSGVEGSETPGTVAELRAAWDDLLAELARARDAIDQPELMPAPPTDRLLAEGYRYLLGFVHSAIERAFFGDPADPFVRHVLQIVNKGTIDNADAIYFMAPIDGARSYVMRGEAPTFPGRKPPHYLIVEVSHGGLAGDSGSLAELRPGVKVRTGQLDSNQIETDADGHFEILLAPERPKDHRGNFIATRRRTSRPHPDQPDGPLIRDANHVSGRQLFYDWEHEEPVALTITPLEPGGEARPADPPSVAARLRTLGALVRGQMHFWNEFNTVLLETYGRRDGGEGERFMPRNAFNAPNAASRETGGGQSTNLYAGGVFELEPDQALIVEARTRVDPDYVGFGIANLWGESLDFAHHQCSLNGFQTEVDADGAMRWVIAHRDPGVANWIDTTGHREGYMSPRWTYTETPPPSLWPTISARVVPLEAVLDQLPPGTRRIPPEERAERMRIRSEHVKRRYRAF